MAQKMIITGGAGFIGVNAVRHFLTKGWEVTIFDNFSRKGTDINLRYLMEKFPTVAVIRGDIRTDIEALEKAAAESDVVLHLAAQVAVTTSVTDPRSDFDINALGTFNVLEAVRKSERKPLMIFASTNKVFGALETYHVRENGDRYEFEDDVFRAYGVPGNHPLDFHSPYGCSKGAADQYVCDYARIYGLKTVVFRQSCIYGTDQFGVEDQGWLAWFAIANLLGRPLSIYGTGKQVRDALYVDDLISLYEKAIERKEVMRGNAYAVGGGPQNTISLIELLDMLDKKMGQRPATSQAAVRPGDQPIFVADIRALERDFGWKPTVGLDQGLDRMIGWIKEHESDIRGLFA